MYGAILDIITIPSIGVPRVTILFLLLFSLLVNGALSILFHAKPFVFSDDMKIFMCIKYDVNGMFLQADINPTVSCGNSLNLVKC